MTSAEHAATVEELRAARDRLLNRRRLGSFYLNDVRLLAALAERATELERALDMQVAISAENKAMLQEWVTQAEQQHARATELEAECREWNSMYGRLDKQRRDAEARAAELERELAELKGVKNPSTANEDMQGEIRELKAALCAVRDYEWHPGQPVIDVRAIARAALGEPAPSSAGECHECGKQVSKRYGGEGRHFAYCADCWGALGETAR